MKNIIKTFTMSGLRSAYCRLLTAYCRLLLLLPTVFFMLSAVEAFPQGVAINTSGSHADTSAMLDVASSNRGMLIPRVALTGTTDATTIAFPANGLVVYNTNASMFNGNGVGFYYYCSSGCTTSGWKFMIVSDNGPGTSGQVLVSQGSGNAPKWLNTSGGLKDGSALGTAMITSYMDSVSLFTPHNNNCNAATEAFVPLFTGCPVGYCIDKNEQAAVSWTNAVRTCLAVGKRLPEPFEWRVGCDNAASLGLTNMTNNNEWGSNFALPLNSSNPGVGVATFGQGGCGFATWSWLGQTTGAASTNAFRCVH